MRPQQQSPARRRWQLLTALALLLALAFAAAGGPAAAGAGGDPPPNIRGDVNCTRHVDSVDAALVLQFTAALIETFACPEAADVDGNASVNSIDASLILQLHAGLQDSLLRMSLTITAPAVPCDDPVTTCAVPAGSAFRLAILVDSAPPEGYVAFQTQVFYGALAYNRAASPANEIVWPASVLPVWYPPDDSDGLGYIAHGSLSSLTPPLPVSHYSGRLVEFELSCPPASGSFKLSLLTYNDYQARGQINPLGSALSFPDQETIAPLRIGNADLDLNLDGKIHREEEAFAIAATLEVRCV